jgi:hypothetical protein
MSNFFDILPSAFLYIFIIFLFEGVLFYIYLFPLEKDAVSKEFRNFGAKTKETIDTFNSLLIQLATENTTVADKVVDPKIIRPNVDNVIAPIIKISKNNEDAKISKDRTNSIIMFSFINFGFVIFLFLYYYIFKHIIQINVNWANIFKAQAFIVIFIIGFVIMYFFNILLNKKINDDKLKVYFINAISSL